MVVPSIANREVPVAAELSVEVRDLGGATRKRGHDARAALGNLGEAVQQKTRFLGRAEVPLSATLAATAGAPPGFDSC